MRIVFDASVIISAFIATGMCKDVFEYAVENHEVIISPYILNELKGKLTQKLGFSHSEYQEIREFLTDSILTLTEKTGKLIEFSDKKDIPILNLCNSVRASLLITGDKQLLKLKVIDNTKIISPSELWNIEREHQL